MVPEQSPTRPLRSGLPPTTLQNQPVVVQLAQRADLEAAAVVITEGFHPPGDWLAWCSPFVGWMIWQDLRQRVEGNDQQYICLVAKSGLGQSTSSSQVVGVVEVALRSPLVGQQPRFAYISNLAVLPDYQRQGVGQKLLLACEEYVVSWGLSELYLHVLESNRPARRLYNKIGYRLQIVDNFWFGMLLGQPKRLLLHKQGIVRAP